MNIRTLLGFLLGRRAAILAMASCPHALWLGLLFVISAGFAREYDGEDLVHEPWRVFLPLVASLISATVLFVASDGIARARGSGAPSAGMSYRAFLSLFWFTAPLAWLYAIPYERFLAPVEAMRANLLTLGVVAAWRVFLMVRVLHVFMGFKVISAIFIVFAFADAVVLVLLPSLPVPLIEIMGGVRLSESEELLKAAGMTTLCWGICSAPVWLIGYIIVAATARPRWAELSATPLPVRFGPWLLGAFALAIWAVILPLTQPEQLMRKRVERILLEGRIEEGLAEMSAVEADAFPPNWDPPPHSVHLLRDADAIVRLMNALADRPQAPWVRALYLEKIRMYLRGATGRFSFYSILGEGQLGRLAEAMARMPEGPELAQELRPILETPNDRWKDEDQAGLKVLRQLAGIEVKQPTPN
jgi:hypothetical protein